MTSEEMERGLEGLQENMTVQGVMMHRLESHLDRLESDLDQLRAIVAQNIEAITKLTGAMIGIQDGMIVMQTAMNNLFEHMDRFIRGLESDGHKGGKKKRPD